MKGRAGRQIGPESTSPQGGKVRFGSGRPVFSFILLLLFSDYFDFSGSSSSHCAPLGHFSSFISFSLCLFFPFFFPFPFSFPVLSTPRRGCVTRVGGLFLRNIYSLYLGNRADRIFLSVFLQVYIAPSTTSYVYRVFGLPSVTPLRHSSPSLSPTPSLTLANPRPPPSAHPPQPVASASRSIDETRALNARRFETPRLDKG
jgi:hypothetical protein